MSDVLKRVFEARRNRQEELRSLYADAEGRALSAEETEKEERLAAEISDLQKREANLVAMDERADEAMEARMASRVPAAESRQAADPIAEQRSAVEKVLRGESRAFEVRDLLAGTATKGAEHVRDIYGAIWEPLQEQSTLLNAGVTVIRTSGGEDLIIPKVTGYSSASLVAEAGALSESDPSFGTTSLGSYKFGFIVQVSSELIQDGSFDIVGFTTRQGGEALGRGLDVEFATGSGTNRPEGIVNAATAVNVTGAAPTADELLDIHYSVPAPYRRNASWVISDQMMLAARKMKDSDDNYLWAPGLTAGQPDTLFGRPVYVDPNFDDMTVGNTVGVFGDLRGFYVRLVGGFRIERSDEYAFANDLTTFRFIARADSGLVDEVGIRKIVTD